MLFSATGAWSASHREGTPSNNRATKGLTPGTPSVEAGDLLSIAQLNGAKVFPAPIVTQVAALQVFYPAEEYHQSFLARHPNYPYIVYNDLPKLRALQAQFPEVYAQ
jgi:peptide-methionine (S)-S-oxide reductase